MSQALLSPPVTRIASAVESPAGHLDDGELMRAVAKGDTDAFAVFYDRHVRRVHSVVLRVLRDPSISQEVTQEVFVEAWTLAARFEEQRGALASWLVTMARRRAIDRVRSEQAARNRDVKSSAINGSRELDEVAETAVLDDEHRQVREALHVLTDVQRDAIERAYFGGRTYREVAEDLDVPLSTIKTRIRDGMMRLRAELELAGVSA